MAAREKMSKTTRKGLTSERKPPELIDKPKIVESACSLSSERITLPCIEKERRTSTKAAKASRESSGESFSGSFWLRPGLSLPKMRVAGKGEQHRESGQQSSSPASAISSGRESYSKLSELVETPPTESRTSLARLFETCSFRSEDVPAKTVGPSECHSSFEVDNSGMISHPLEFDDPAPEESKALKNWKRWMKIRHRQTDRMSEMLKRKNFELVMNTADDMREVNEEKSMLTYAQIQPPDKWRGSPLFWKQPVQLAQRGMKDTYYAYTTLTERGIVPPLEFVSLPDAVKIEKGVSCDDSASKIRWQRLEYRKMQRKRYSKQFKEMKPHEVEGRDLIVVGEKIVPEEESECSVQYDLPDIQVTPEDDSITQVEEFALSYVRDSVVKLVINGVELSYIGDESAGDGNRDGTRTWSLIFEEAPIRTITERSLHVENKGTVAVRYDWRPEPKATLAGFPERRTSIAGPNFFFNKNPGIFLPGQKSDIPFYHHSRNPGYHHETWRLVLKPNLFGTGYGRIALVAVAENDKTPDNFSRVEKYLDSLVRDTVVREVLSELLERSEREVPEGIEYTSLFMEEELFEFQNPAHYYRYSIVEELKSLYKKIPLDPPQEWDLNLFTLEDAIRENVTGKSQRTMLCELMDRTRSLLRPGQDCYKSNNKHKMLYNALCGAVDAMSAKALRIRENIYGMEEGWEQSPEDVEMGETTGAPALSSTTSSMIQTFETASEADAGEKSSRRESFAVNSSDLPHYQFALYTTFFHCLGEAVEQAAGIVETSKLFEHHGEIIKPKNSGSVDDELW